MQVGFKRTGRKCAEPGCKGRLKDFILDWEDALPEDELAASEEAASAADLAICLGTSLQITPACDLPLRTPKAGTTQNRAFCTTRLESSAPVCSLRSCAEEPPEMCGMTAKVRPHDHPSLILVLALCAGGRLVIVNLQKTPKDKKAALLIRGRADEVMRAVMRRLQIHIPPFVRQDTFLVDSSVHSGSKEGLSLEARISSTHGPECTMPLVHSIDVSFPVSLQSISHPTISSDGLTGKFRTCLLDCVLWCTYESMTRRPKSGCALTLLGSQGAVSWESGMLPVYTGSKRKLGLQQSAQNGL